MRLMAKRYITTAIDYPNAAPHLGHVLEKVLADVLARFWRLNGDDVRFQIGTDEHGIKIQQTAKKQGVTPEELVDRNVPLFEHLYRKLNVSADIFIRTSDRKISWPNIDEVKHKPTVEAMWKKLMDAGMLEKRTYTGLYCSGCERFITAKDLVDGKCPDHGIAPEEVKEENWFFVLSKETAWLKKLLKKEYVIVPDYRAEETLALLDRGLEDVSFSRPTSSLSWGIPVPGEADQTMYVWCDALTNYISGIGLLTSQAKTEWWDDAEITHVIGKDIARFHSLIWPAMLKAAGLRTPDRLLMHGFVTNDGKKMSKSLGNVVEPTEVLAHFDDNPDPMRFFLCHEIPVGRDGDFGWDRLVEIYDAKLRNQLGNMLNRVLVMMNKDEGTVKIPSSKSDVSQTAKLWKDYEKKMNDMEIHSAIQDISAAVSAMNTAFNDAAPWKMKDDADKRIETLGSSAECLRQIALMLLPFIPDTAYRISKQLGVPYAEDMLRKEFVITKELKAWAGAKSWTKVGQPEILFAPLEI
jgi:methionyl-tRNA synthetase